MFPAAMHLLQIKDLKDLNFSSPLPFYRHAGLKRLEEVFSRVRASPL